MNKEVLACLLSWYPFSFFRKAAPLFKLPISSYEGCIFNIVRPSTQTIGGIFTGVALHEEHDIGKFKATGDIVLVGSNYGEDWQPGFAPKIPQPESERKTKRGRKPKAKEKKRRKKGNGRYFSSQITFVVRSHSKPGKVYKFKVFRTGVFQVPGVLSTDREDMNEPINTLREYLQSHFPQHIGISNIGVQMRNCKSILSDSDLQIMTRTLGETLEREIKDSNPMKIFGVEYLTDKNSTKTVIKFSRPTKANPSKVTTLKILKQKINFEGGVSLEDIEIIYTWLNYFLLDHYNVVMIDPANKVVSDSDSESEADEPTPMSRQDDISADPYQLN